MSATTARADTTTCTSCGAPIVFFTTATGRLMPVDAETVAVDDKHLDVTRHRSHFATCPNAATHRKVKR